MFAQFMINHLSITILFDPNKVKIYKHATKEIKSMICSKITDHPKSK